MKMTTLCAAIFATILAFGAAIPTSSAQATGHDSGTLLIVSSPAEEDLALNLMDLDALMQSKIRTVNEFVSGTVEFGGPLARDLVSKVGGDRDSTIVLTAINEYQITVPASDFFEYNVILATRMDGALLSRRDKGPIWLMYPISDHAELQDSAVNSKLIWQLVRMEVR